MIAIVSLFVVVVLSLVVTRVGAVALRLTGMSQDAARFQARSALTGSGFTTSESEQIVTHPLRRKIIGILMLLGNIGLVAASGTLIVSLVGIEGGEGSTTKLFVLIFGLVILYFVATSKLVDRIMCGIISRALRRYTELETRDFSTLLHLHGDYQIAEIKVKVEDQMAGKSLEEAGLKSKGVLVLGVIDSAGEYIGAPDAQSVIRVGQTLVIYGLPHSVHQLDCRCSE
jgi:TrkA-C domain